MVMNPMLDPDLMEFMDDESLLLAFAMASAEPGGGDAQAIQAEMTRRGLRPIAAMPGLLDVARTDHRSGALRL
ncbi:hypothetical protein AV944_17190 [Sphingomonas sp. LK11]|jgi:hypothetical protein|nr:hypothetical protein AV944_17190 [Sphingomonas sp. LK11]KQO50964.1 hypothetical protein ASF14_08700 [Sphingomonas sp. Leaf257]